MDDFDDYLFLGTLALFRSIAAQILGIKGGEPLPTIQAEGKRRQSVLEEVMRRLKEGKFTPKDHARRQVMVARLRRAEARVQHELKRQVVAETIAWVEKLFEHPGDPAPLERLAVSLLTSERVVNKVRKYARPYQRRRPNGLDPSTEDVRDSVAAKVFYGVLRSASDWYSAYLGQTEIFHSWFRCVDLTLSTYVSAETRMMLGDYRTGAGRPEVQPGEDVPEPADNHPDPISALAAREQVEQPLKNLLELDREIIRLHYFKGMTFKEIAQRLGLTARRVRYRHNKAVQRLLFILGEE